MKYILASEIINDVKEKLHTYFERDMIDESILYTRLKKLIPKFRLNVNPTNTTVLYVENYKTELPNDFYKACMALGCFQYVAMDCDRYNETYQIDQEEVCEFNVCETICDVCTNECGDLFRIVQKFNRNQYHVHTEFDVLSLSKNSYKNCINNCFNSKSTSQNTIEIKETEIHTGFETGMIYLEYLQSLELSDDFQIPEQQTILDWIEAELTHEVFKIAFYNGEPNISTQYQETKKEAAIKEYNAKVVLKTPEVDEMYRVTNHLIERYNRVRNNVYDENTFRTNFRRNHRHGY